jgi:hypothetical protein
MTPGQILAAILLAMTITAGGAWKIQDWRYEGRLAEQADLHKNDLAAISNAAVTQARTEQDKRLSTDKTLAESDRQHSLELSNEQRKQAALRDRLAIADVRLSVLLDAADSASGCNVPATPGAFCVVHGTARAKLAPAHAQRILAITGDGDQALIALRACQKYARTVAR